MPHALELRSVSVSLGGRTIVRDVSMHVDAGTVTALFGPSGAGKSTLFRAVVGDARATGEVLLGGRSLGDLPVWARARAGLGFVPQGPSVLHDLTVDENLATFARLARSSAPVDPLIDAVDLGARRGVRAGDLSGGERRRLEVARALVASPVALLCDEPFAGLSPAAIEGVASLLRARARAGLAVVVSDHHVAEALAIADAACLLLDGALELACPADEFAAHPLVSARYTGSPRSA